MTSTDRIRRRAWAVRASLGFANDTLAKATDVIAALEISTGILRQFVDAADPILGGAQAVLDSALFSIYQNGDLPPTVRAYDAAHEYGHWFLHQQAEDGSGKCECSGEDLNTDLDNIDSLPAAKVVGYSAREQRESEANLFAAEILLPLPLAKSCYETERWTSSRIGLEIGIGEAIARRQLTEAVLLPALSPSIEVVIQKPAPLDPSQNAAATVATGPTLLTAGPGTGKTKTLVGRCLFLTQTRNVRPESILALTFSRKAAAEMHERLLLAGVGQEGRSPWIGTFHSFGMELLRKYGDRIGLDPQFGLIDQLDAITLLENNSERLQLMHLTTVRNPSQYLSGILRRISRAKDELCDPDSYRRLAFETADKATEKALALEANPGKRLKKDEREIAGLRQEAARLTEVARCYATYQDLLRENNLVDYADLIARSVELLSFCPDIRERLHRQYPFVLADEYQDVNRASARLLRELAGERAEGLWVVGDHRQSIYQFQGASPANVSLFHTDYPNGALFQLSVNYRSVREIVQTFGLASRSLSFTGPGTSGSIWTAFRGESSSNRPACELALVNQRKEQYVAIKDRIEKYRDDGISLAGQVILCRTHSQARDAASTLSELGIPTLYLGQLLERPEIKGLIAILASCSGKSSAAIARAAQIPEYGLTEHDAVQIAKILNEDYTNDFSALEVDAGISAKAADGARALMTHLQSLRPLVERPAALVRSYLFEFSRFIELISRPEAGPFVRMQSLLAVRQFVDILDGFDRRAVVPTSGTENRTMKALTHLRRLSDLGVTTPLPDGESVDDIDAVRVLTAHSAKGLEFPVVFLPNLNEGYFPPRSPHDGVPEPAGLFDVGQDQADEEECLFFVGLSRAKDHLVLTRFLQKDNGDPVAESSLLSSLNAAIDSGDVTVANYGDSQPPADRPVDDVAAEVDDLGQVLPIYSSSELETYQRCPRLYYYERVAKLLGTSADDGYLKLHLVISKLVDWLQSEVDSGITPGLNERRTKLEEIWKEQGPVGHKHEMYFLHEAERVAEAEQQMSGVKPLHMTMTAKLRNALVQVRPDRIEIDGDKLKVTRRIIGDPGESDHTHRRLALFRRAASDTKPELKPVINLHYVTDGSTVEVADAPRYEPARLLKYEDAVDGIKSNHFPAKPQSADTCANCAFLFVCPRDG